MIVGAPIPILYFSNEFERGGAEEHLLTLLRSLDRRHFRPLLACTPQMAALLGKEVPEDVEVLPLCLRKPHHLSAAYRLTSALRRRRVMILHSHMFYASFFASPVGRFAGVPVVIETPHVRERWRRGWLKSSYLPDRFAARFVNYFVAVSNSNAHYLIEEKKLPKQKIIVIRNGCDLHRFDPSHRAPAGMKTKLGFGESDPLLVVIGRLEPQKGHSVLLHAMPATLREIPNLRLVCVGEGSLKQPLATLTHNLGISGSVRFVGFQSNITDWLALADATVLPSFYEGLPLAAIESLAAGRPVIASHVDGTPEVVVNGVSGLTFAPGDIVALSSAMVRLLSDRQWLSALGRAGRQWVLRFFSKEQQVRETEALYFYALKKRRVALGRGTDRPRYGIDVEDIESRLGQLAA